VNLSLAAATRGGEILITVYSTGIFRSPKIAVISAVIPSIPTPISGISRGCSCRGNFKPWEKLFHLLDPCYVDGRVSIHSDHYLSAFRRRKR
jgi:hypothetical protein